MRGREKSRKVVGSLYDETFRNEGRQACIEKSLGFQGLNDLERRTVEAAKHNQGIRGVLERGGGEVGLEGGR